MCVYIYMYLCVCLCVYIYIYICVCVCVCVCVYIYENGKKMKVSVAQSCLTLCNPMDCSSPGSSVHGIFQARILEWVSAFPRGSSWPRIRTHVSCIAGGFFTIELPGKPISICITELLCCTAEINLTLEIKYIVEPEEPEISRSSKREQFCNASLPFNPFC